MIYADYEYYIGIYGGTMGETDFRRLARQASAKLDALTFGRLEHVTDKKTLSRARDACCAMTETLHKSEQGGEVASETVGKWSRTFAGSGKTADRQLYDTAATYLADTGLMYRGAGCGCCR